MLLSAWLLALGLAACGAAGAVNPAASPAAPAPTALPDENAPEISEPAVSVEPYSDLRYLPWLDDYAKQTYQPDEYNASDLYTYTYNTGTAFAGAEDEAAALLEECKDPGLGVRSLQARGITGRGVNIAILDQPLLTDHPEFADRIAAYYDTGCEGETGSMHGIVVTGGSQPAGGQNHRRGAGCQHLLCGLAFLAGRQPLCRGCTGLGAGAKRGAVRR